MNTTAVYVYVKAENTDDWILVGSLTFTSMNSRWMLEDKLPEERDIVPWQEMTLPSGETLRLGLVFDDPEKSLSLYIRSGDRPVLELITKGRPCLRLATPDGGDISLQIHE